MICPQIILCNAIPGSIVIRYSQVRGRGHAPIVSSRDGMVPAFGCVGVTETTSIVLTFASVLSLVSGQWPYFPKSPNPVGDASAPCRNPQQASGKQFMAPTSALLGGPQQRVLEIPEILELIFSFLDVEANVTNALVCRKWSDIALNNVWRDVSDVRRLFSLLAPMRNAPLSRYDRTYRDEYVSACSMFLIRLM